MYKLIIFDVDGTFYDLEDVIQSNYEIQVDFYAEQKKLPKECVKRLFEQERILPYKSQNARSATEYFLKNGIDADIWKEYRENHTSPQRIRKETAVSNELVKKYAEVASLVLLSSNSLRNIQNTLQWLEIDQTLFKDIFCSTANVGCMPFSKMKIVPQILSKYKLAPASVLCIGDRYESDILPLISLGGKGVLVEKPADLEEILQDISNGMLGSGVTRNYRYFG